MKKATKLLGLLLALTFLSACAQVAPSVGSAPVAPSSSQGEVVAPSSSQEEGVAPVDGSKLTDKERAAEILSTMTLQEKVGQIFFVRCPEAGWAELVSENKVGGILLFRADFKDKTMNEIVQKNRELQANAKIPLLIGADEEGGTVVRASSNPYLRGKKFASPQEIFAAGGWDAIVQNTIEKSAFLKALGVNLNLAPVADISTDPADFINERSFGKDTAQTVAFITTVVGQMQLDGMGSALKHFPGYGNNIDTHTGIAIDNRTLEHLRQADLLPFAAGIDAGKGTTSVLVSHNVITAVDDSLPASLSPAVYKLLREELHYDGVAITDDLIMDAVKQYIDGGSAAVMAVQAGSDLVISSNFGEEFPAVLAAAEDGRIPMTRLDEAVSRVLIWKMALGLL